MTCVTLDPMNKNKLFRRILIGGMLLAAAGVIVSVIHHYQLRAAVNQYRAELKAKGDLVELSQAAPPLVAPDKDGTALLMQAIELLNKDSSLLTTNYATCMKAIAPGRAMIASRQPEVTDFETTNSWEDVVAVLQQNQKALDLLSGMVERPAVDFKMQYGKGFEDISSFAVLNLGAVKKSVQYLSAAGLANLHAGDSAAAVTNTRSMLVLTAAVQDERLMISELVSLAMVSFANSLTWEILQSRDITKAQLAGLQSDYEKLNFLTGYEHALTMEQCCGDITLAHWRQSDAALQMELDDWTSARAKFGLTDAPPGPLVHVRQTLQMFLWRYWWSYSDELRALRGYEVLQQTVRDIKKPDGCLAAFQHQEAGLKGLGLTKMEDEPGSPTYAYSLFSEPVELHTFLSKSISVIAGAGQRVMMFESARQIVITAIALKRYQLQHGHWPDQLAELVPQFLAAIPQDAMTSQPLPYHRQSDGTFLLYSVGEDGVDNGGDPTLTKDTGSTSFYWLNPKAHDWVWPQAATPAEIDAFYQRELHRRH